MSNLWSDLDDIDDEDDERDDGPNYEVEEYDDLYDQLADEAEDEVICPVCKAIVEDYTQCQNCGYVIGV